MTIHHVFAFCLSLFVSIGIARAEGAGTLPLPEGRPILTITGAITVTNQTGAAAFDLAMLDALGIHETRTSTPWHEGVPAFSGPLASDLLRAVGATGGTVRLIALNDYSADVPVEDFLQYPSILATRLNGTPMSVRQNGPVFLIYPFDQFPDLYNEVYFGRSVWQIARIEVIE